MVMSDGLRHDFVKLVWEIAKIVSSKSKNATYLCSTMKNE